MNRQPSSGDWGRVLIAAVVTAMAISTAAFAQTSSDPPDPILFSGPQKGETLQGLKVWGVLDDLAGQELDFVKKADGKPLVLVFVHDVNRQSLSMVRILTTYTTSRSQEGLQTGVVWLDDDRTNAESTIKRVRHALAKDAPVGISVDGREGPGSYGLNRKVMLTILIAQNERVMANFALVQPSLSVDLPKIVKSIVDVVGGKVPKLEELVGPEMAGRMGPTNSEPVNLRPWLIPVIRLGASVDDVDAAAKALEEYLEKNPEAQVEIARITNTIIRAGKLENYGTERAREYLERWSKEYPRDGGNKRPTSEPKPNEPSPPSAKPDR